MTTRNKIKQEIDRVPEEMLEKVHKYINAITTASKIKKKFPTYKLKGQFDKLNVRKRAYE
jgi:hypothetical protein